MGDEYNEKLCDERHERVDDLHTKQDQQTEILIRLDAWAKSHTKTHDKGGLRLHNVITYILSLAAVTVAVFALAK